MMMAGRSQFARVGPMRSPGQSRNDHSNAEQTGEIHRGASGAEKAETAETGLNAEVAETAESSCFSLRVLGVLGV
jgi:hypothetical protein